VAEGAGEPIASRPLPAKSLAQPTLILAGAAVIALAAVILAFPNVFSRDDTTRGTTRETSATGQVTTTQVDTTTRKGASDTLVGGIFLLGVLLVLTGAFYSRVVEIRLPGGASIGLSREEQRRVAETITERLAERGLEADPATVALASLAASEELRREKAAIVFPRAPWWARLPLLRRLERIEVGPLEIALSSESIRKTVDEAVERFVFVGDRLPVDRQQELQRELGEFAGYLGGLGLEWDRPIPNVRWDQGDESYLALYDPDENEIRLGGAGAVVPDFALKELCYYALHGALYELDEPMAREIANVPGEDDALASASILSGLATYLPCSFREDSRFARGWPPPVGVDLEEVHSAAAMPRVGTSASIELRILTVTALGNVWASAFWELRGLVGQDTLDHVLIKAWWSANEPGAKDRALGFAGRLVDRLGGPDPARTPEFAAAFSKRDLVPALNGSDSGG